MSDTWVRVPEFYQFPLRARRFEIPATVLLDAAGFSTSEPPDLPAWAEALILCARRGYDDIPDGVQPRSIQIDHYRKVITIVLEHETFDPVPDGGEIPLVSLDAMGLVGGGAR